MATINKEEFDKKLNSLRTKYALEDNTTLTWVIYILIFAIAVVLLIGTTIVLCMGLIMFVIGMPFAFAEGVIKGFRKND
tara:strand:- start:4563 stop:4799 length:237 start_codon:yes stop_codon:yes gene_type:complete